MSIPARLGRYEILSSIGRGAMGAVYKASDPALDRVVAIKTIHAVLLAGDDLRDEFLERFRREARAAGRLSHPNIVSVFDLGLDEASGAPFIVMEYVPGVSLEAVLAENPVLPIAQAMEIVDQVGSALEEAHRHGVVHRDVKPANIFLDDRGRVKVGDFGVARLEGSELTQTGVRVGTPGYTAPEVLQGGVADARADVFALGVLAYRLFTGSRPFSGTVPEALVLEILQREPAPPSTVRPEVTEQVSAAIMEALVKAPAGRTASARAFLERLHGAAGLTEVRRPPALATATPGAMPTRTDRAEPTPEQPRRWLRVAGVIAVVLLLGLAAFLGLRALARDPAAAAAPRTVTPAKAPPVTSPRSPAPAAPGRANPSPDAGEAAAIERARAILKGAEVLLREGQDTTREEDKPGRGKGRGKKKKAKERE